MGQMHAYTWPFLCWIQSQYSVIGKILLVSLLYHISNNWYYKDKVFEKKNWSSFQKMTRSATAAASSETMCEICCVPVPGAVSILLNHFDQRFQWNYISVLLNFFVPEWKSKLVKSWELPV